MGSSCNGFSTISLLLLLVLLYGFTTISIPTANSQNTGNSPTFPECQRTLMVLIPCQPFVQGMSTFPSLACCSNLQQFLGEDDKELRCFCFLMNVPTLPFNRALALQLPSLCRLNNATPSSTCSGLPLPQPQPEPEPEPSPVTPISPPPQENFQSSSNSTEADSPVVTVIPKSNIMGFGFQNSGEKLGAEIEIHVAMLALLLAVIIDFSSFN